MSSVFPGYRVKERLYESGNSLVYRGQRTVDNLPVVLKMLKDTYPSPEKTAWFRREYDITHSLSPTFDSSQALPGVVAAYDLDNSLQRQVMVLEDFGGESLARLRLAGTLTTLEFLSLAIKISEILGRIHQKYIIHKDINPSNVVYNSDTQQVKIIDFGIASVLSRENPTFRSPNVLEGTLAYISPEQTGRMNRVVDYRTDFYSLGVTFYELLTGELPFPADDPLELVHCHIAKSPQPPHQFNANIPPVLSEITLKLLAKNAEDRYQSAFGLKADLEECLRQLQSTGQLIWFDLGQHDVSDQFQLPQKLYGREQEIDTLLTAFERASQGSTELMLVSGYPGIGKSALVQEIYKPITHQKGYFIAGKFDQFKRNVPYAPFIQAFQSLIRQLLTETESQVAAWRQKLLQALGSNGAVIIDVIPEVKLIIDPQPDVPELASAATQNRFNLTFQDFVQVFAHPDHPLVIFLDDLQWADAASLSLIQRLLTLPDNHHLFFIGAYRDNEVTATDPLMLTIDAVQQARVTVNHISLQPLELPHVNQLISELLRCPPEKSDPLARLVLAKTGGNPFFMNEFLKTLYDEGLLKYVPAIDGDGWQWNLQQIEGLGLTDNVVQLMAAKMQKLQPKTQETLKFAACIGHQFSLHTLAIISGQPITDTALHLNQAVEEGLILPLNSSHNLVGVDVPELADELSVEYKMAHDRIRDAAYSLIPDDDKQAIHRQVGQLLLQKTPPDQVDDNIFDIVNQLNFGAALIESQTERDQLAELNLKAGEKAKSSAAYQPALNYFQTGLALLDSSDDCWTRQYVLSLALHVEAAEAAYLNSNFEQMDQWADIVLRQAQTLLDKVPVYEIRIQAHIAQSKPLEAISVAREVLKLLEVDFPENPGQQEVQRALQNMASVLEGRQIEELIDLPQMQDPHKLAAMRILTSVAIAALFAAPPLFALIGLKRVELSIRHGNAPMSAVAYVTYALILCGQVGDIETGYRMGKLAFDLLERSDDTKAYKATTLVTGHGGITHWKEHIAATLEPFLQAYQSGLETGDLQFAAYATRMYCSRAYLAGYELTELAQVIINYSEAINRLGQTAALQGTEVMQQAIVNLIEPSSAPCRLEGQYYNEDKMLPLHLEANDSGAAFAYYFNKLIVCYLFQNYTEALTCITEAEKHAGTAVGSPFGPILNFYDSLTCLALYATTPAIEQAAVLEKVAANQEQMKRWADHAPMNYLHKYYLVEAEQARINNNNQAAREFYYQATVSAQENDYIHEAALAHELAAQFYFGLEQPGLARYHLQEAYYCYQRWGANVKVEQLESQYPEILGRTLPDRFSATITPTAISTGRHAAHQFDLASVLKATRTLSGEIVLDKLLKSLMQVVIENAGAQVGYLILEKQGRWVIGAQSAINNDDVAVLQSIPVTEQNLPLSVINYVARTQENVVLNDAANLGDFTRDPYLVAHQPQSVLCTPLLNQAKLIGMLYLENNLTSNAFTPDRLAVLDFISSQAAISIENATLYTNLEENERKYRTLFEDSKDAIFITNPEGWMLDMNQAGLALFGYSHEEILQMRAIDFYVNPDDQFNFLQEMEQYGAVRDFELKVRRKDNTERDCVVTATIRQAADGTVLAYQGIIRDITHRKQAERERLQLTAIQRELTVAHQIQQSLLPAAKPDWAGPSVLCYSKAAREVGGDFYAYHAFGDNRYTVAVGDVSGKGTPAALVMAIGLASFQAIIKQRLTPSELLGQLDQAIKPYTVSTSQNCALVVAEITPISGGEQGGVMRVANAGCVTPIIRRVDGTVEWVEVGGLPLGVGLFENFEYQESSLILSKGDAVILVSDGVIEAINAADELFGFDRFEQVVAHAPATGVDTILEYLKLEVEIFVGDVEASDDITIVVLQV